MTNLSTLRIIFGHPNINDALLRSVFDRQRPGRAQMRRLWLENCRISAGCNMCIDEHPLGLPLELDFSGLESVRFRRLPARPGKLPNNNVPMYQYVHSRSGTVIELQDGAGGSYGTRTNDARRELAIAGLDQRLYRDAVMYVIP